MSGIPTPAPTWTSFKDWTEEEFEQVASVGGDEVNVEAVEEVGIELEEMEIEVEVVDIEVEAAVFELTVTVANAPRLLI